MAYRVKIKPLKGSITVRKVKSRKRLIKQLNASDRDFIYKKLFPFFKVRYMKLRYSPAKWKHPDIWYQRDNNGLPVITITDEWLKQSTHERRKRLTHEFIHYAWRMPMHGWYRLPFPGSKEVRFFSTDPAKDTFSKYVYERMIGKYIAIGRQKLVTKPVKKPKPKVKFVWY